MSYNTGIIDITDILKISHSRGVEKKLRDFLIFFFLIHMLSQDYFLSRYWLFFLKSYSQRCMGGTILGLQPSGRHLSSRENIQYSVVVEDFDQRRSLTARMATRF